MEGHLLYSLWHNTRIYGNNTANETRFYHAVVLHSIHLELVGKIHTLPQNHSIKLLIYFRHIPDSAVLRATSKT